MNLLIFEREELDSENQLALTDYRFEHLRTVLGSAPGDSLRVGELNGRCGQARVLELDDHRALLQVTLDRSPPSPLPLTVVLALPRPKMLRRILRTLAEVGVKDVHLINSYRVEKSFWQSPLLEPAGIAKAFRTGLEQGMDTIVPTLSLHRRFRPFAEDTLPGLCSGHTALLADPRAEEPYPARPATPALLIIGPEGGFIPFEVELLRAAGARSVSLGERILRTETALLSTLGRHLAVP